MADIQQFFDGLQAQMKSDDVAWIIAVITCLSKQTEISQDALCGIAIDCLALRFDFPQEGLGGCCEGLKHDGLPQFISNIIGMNLDARAIVAEGRPNNG